jgi:hypothetical protein
MKRNCTDRAVDCMIVVATFAVAFGGATLLQSLA